MSKMSRLIVVDTETTGISHKNGERIIELGCVEIVNREITGKNFQKYINPNRRVDPGAYKVHRLSNEFLKDKPPFSDIIDDFISYISDSPLIFYNAPFDMGFLKQEFLNSNKNTHILEGSRMIYDALVLARKKFQGQKNTLNHVCDRLSISRVIRDNAHGALIDAELTAKVYLKLTEHVVFDETPPTAKKENISEESNKTTSIYASNKINNGMLNGVHTKEYSNGDKYVGEFKDDVRHGTGTFTWASGDKYVGEWENGSRICGIYFFSNGNKYVGEFKDNIKHGTGTFTWASGGKFVGEWENDSKTSGMHYDSETGKLEYIGELKNNEFHGVGIYIYDDGDKYVGEYRNSIHEGLGMFFHNDGDKSVGEYKNSKREGLGMFFHNDGDKSVGEYKNSKREGLGMFLPNDGSEIDVSQYHDGISNGTQVVFGKDSSVEIWKYQNGEIISGPEYIKTDDEK